MKRTIKMIIIILPIILLLIGVYWDIFVRDYYIFEVNDNNLQEIIEILDKDGFNYKNLQSPSIIRVKINPFMSVNSEEYHLEYYDINGNRIIGGGEIKELSADKYAIIDYLQNNTLDISRLQKNLYKISIELSFVTIVYSLILKIIKQKNKE